jgi:uncharacterized protein (TIGR04255 family)
MPLRLPEIDHRPLTRPPLEVVVFQVRFEQNLALVAGDTLLRLHEHLHGADGPYPRVESQQVVAAQMQIGPQGITQLPSPASQPVRGVRMRSDDGAWTVSVMPDFVALETTAYTTWADDCRARIQDILTAIDEHVHPRVEERIGLRYVNRISEPEVAVPADFQGLVSEGLLGAAADEFWTAGITGIQQQIEIHVSADIQCILRHGTIPRNTGFGIDGYLLDIDLFRQQPRRFNVDSIIACSDQLNDAATALFQNSLTSSYLDRLRESEVSR